MKRLFAIIAALAAVAVLVAGCGSGDGTTSSTTSLTKAEYINHGNAICSAGSAEIQTGIEKLGKEDKIRKGHPTAAQIEEITKTVLVPSISRQIDAIGALGFPEGEEEKYETFLENATAAVKRLEEDPSLIGSGEQPLADVNREANEIGLAKCGE